MKSPHAQREIVIATIQHQQGVTGLNTHIDQFRHFLEIDKSPVTVVTPLHQYKLPAVAAFAVRRLIDPVSGALGVWWFYRCRSFFLRLALAHHLRQGQDCVVYAQCLVSAEAALQARKHAGQAVVMAVHFNRSEAEEWHQAGKIDRGDWVYRGLETLEAGLMPRLDGLHFVSLFMRDYVAGRYQCAAACKSAVIPNFIADPDNSRTGERDADLISIGPLEHRKNQSYLIRVLHEAKKLGHRYSLALVGPGPDHQKLQRLAHKLGVFDQVRILGFQRDASRLMPRYRAYVHSARIENYPLVLVEAAAHGLPVLAAPVGGVPEVFEDGKQGVFWPLEDPAEGARKLVALLEDEVTYARVAKAARTRFETCNAAPVLAPQLRDFLMSVGR